MDATLAAAARRRLAEQLPGDGTPGIEPEDWRRKLRARPSSLLVLFVVDTSDSMGTQARLSAAKGAVLGLLTRAHQRHARVALVTFEGSGASVALAPTRSVALARRRLAELPTGGATPMGDGLRLAWQLCRAERRKDPRSQPLLVLLSDGEPNVPLCPGADPWTELAGLARGIRNDGLASIVIHTGSSSPSSQPMGRLGHCLGAAFHQVAELRASFVVRAVTSQIDG